MLRSLTQRIHYRILLFVLSVTTPNPIEYLCPLISNPKLLLKIVGVSIGKNVRIGNGLIVHNFNPKNLIIGNGVHIGKRVLLDTSDLISIQDRCTISMGVTIITHLNLGDSNLASIYQPTQSPLIIKNDCYIGANTTIIAKVGIIGESTLIGANSLINKDLVGNSLYVGSPVKKASRIL